MRNETRSGNILGAALAVGLLLVGMAAASKAQAAEFTSMDAVRYVKALDGNTRRARIVRSLFILAAYEAGTPVKCWAAEIERSLFVILQAPQFGVVERNTIHTFLNRLMRSPGELFQTMGFQDVVYVLMATPYDPPRAVGNLADREIVIR